MRKKKKQFFKLKTGKRNLILLLAFFVLILTASTYAYFAKYSASTIYGTVTNKAQAATEANMAASGATATSFDVGVKIPYSSSTHYTDYKGYIKDIYRFALDAGFALAVLMFMFAGYRYLTSQGNSTAVNDAKDIMIGAVIGFIILLLAKIILNVLGLDSSIL